MRDSFKGIFWEKLNKGDWDWEERRLLDMTVQRD